MGWRMVLERLEAWAPRRLYDGGLGCCTRSVLGVLGGEWLSELSWLGTYDVIRRLAPRLGLTASQLHELVLVAQVHLGDDFFLRRDLARAQGGAGCVACVLDRAAESRYWAVVGRVRLRVAEEERAP